MITDATLGLSKHFKWQDANGNHSFYKNLKLSLNHPLLKHNEQKMALKEVELEVENAEPSYAFAKTEHVKSHPTRALQSVQEANTRTRQHRKQI